MKPKELWIFNPSYTDYRDMYPSDPKDTSYIHFRQVIPIDWDKIWRKLDKYVEGGVTDLNIPIQELVEKQLRGEDD